MLKGSTERHGVTPRHSASQDHAELQHPVEAHRVKMPNVILISKLSRTFAKGKQLSLNCRGSGTLFDKIIPP